MTNGKTLCPHCGAELAQGASFCPRCTATLTQRRTLTTPPRTGVRRKWLPVLLLLLAAAAAALLLLRPQASGDPDAAPDSAADSPTPDPYLTACQTYYTAEDGREYHIFTAGTPDPYMPTTPVGLIQALIPDGGSDDRPATVMVQDAVSQEDVADDFLPLLDGWDVTVKAPEGAGRISLWEADDETAESPALLYRRLRGDNTCAQNEIVWTLRMKNGDVLTVTQTVWFLRQETRSFSWQDTPLDTAEDLQALLDRLAEEYDADTLLHVQLPEVTYDRPVTVRCAVTLTGSGTVFAAPVTVAALTDTELCHAYVRFSKCSFRGSGGTGVTAGAPTYLEDCRVSGWDVGAEAITGGWVYLCGGYVGENGVGARYDSSYSSSYTYMVDRIDFMGNGTALELLAMPPQSYMSFNRCRFSGNDTDVHNPNGYRLEYLGT